MATRTQTQTKKKTTPKKKAPTVSAQVVSLVKFKCNTESSELSTPVKSFRNNGTLQKDGASFKIEASCQTLWVSKDTLNSIREILKNPPTITGLDKKLKNISLSEVISLQFPYSQGYSSYSYGGNQRTSYQGNFLLIDKNKTASFKIRGGVLKMPVGDLIKAIDLANTQYVPKKKTEKK